MMGLSLVRWTVSVEGPMKRNELQHYGELLAHVKSRIR